MRCSAPARDGSRERRTDHPEEQERECTESGPIAARERSTDEHGPHAGGRVVAVILSGGLGTRLKPFTMTIPKPLLPLGEIPILEVVVRQLAAAGFTRIVLTLGYMAPVFAAFFGDGSKWGIRIDYCREEHPLGTAGSLLLADSVGDRCRASSWS
jgi:hypothetical protein